MEIANIDRENLQVLKDLRDFKEIFRKDLAYNDIKSHKKPGFLPLFRRHIFGKPAVVEVKLIPPAFFWVKLIYQ